jgi:hypothetical protein
MESSTGILLGKIGFYLALAALVIILIIKKRKQIKGSQNTYIQKNKNKHKPT